MPVNETMGRMVGKYSHTLDSKSRVSVPAALRKKLGEIIYLTVSDGDYLFGYTEDGWEKFDRRLELMDEDEAAYIRGKTAECAIDAQGRIMIPHDLRDFAGLETNVVIQGDGDKIRIWKTESFEQQNAEMSQREKIRAIRKQVQSFKSQTPDEP